MRFMKKYRNLKMKQLFNRGFFRNNKMNKKLEPETPARKPNKRHQARAFAMQAIFQWHFSEETPEILIQEFVVDHLREENIDIAYFRSLVYGTLKNIVTIDEIMTPFLDRKITLLNPVELSVLRLAFLN